MTVAAPSLPVRDRLRERRRGYHGEEVVTAFIFTLAQPSPAFPPKGTAGTQPVLGKTGRDLEWYLSDPLRYRKKDADIVRPLVTAKVVVKNQSEWDNIRTALVELRVFRIVGESELPVADGEIVLCGCVGVLKTGSSQLTANLFCDSSWTCKPQTLSRSRLRATWAWQLVFRRC